MAAARVRTSSRVSPGQVWGRARGGSAAIPSTNCSKRRRACPRTPWGFTNPAHHSCRLRWQCLQRRKPAKWKQHRITSDRGGDANQGSASERICDEHRPCFRAILQATGPVSRFRTAGVRGPGGLILGARGGQAIASSVGTQFGSRRLAVRNPLARSRRVATKTTSRCSV